MTTKPLIPRTKLAYVLCTLFAFGASYAIQHFTRPWLNSQLVKAQADLKDSEQKLKTLCSGQTEVPACKDYQ